MALRILTYSTQNTQYLIHFPAAVTEHGVSVPFPVEETWREMEQVLELGLAKSIGVCNYSAEELKRVLAVAKVKPAVNQVECHPLLWAAYTKDLHELCDEHDIKIVTYAAIGRPKTGSDSPCATLLQSEVAKRIAKAHGKTTAQVLLRFQLDLGHGVLVKTTSQKNMNENADIFDFTLSEAELEELTEWGRQRPARVVNPPLRPGGANLFSPLPPP